MGIEAAYEGPNQMQIPKTAKEDNSSTPNPEFTPPSETQTRRYDILPMGKTTKSKAYDRNVDLQNHRPSDLQGY